MTAVLGQCGEWVIEFDRATQKPSKDGSKTDELDAIRAARETLGREKLASPRAHQGFREALRVHMVARDSAVRARTAAINELKAFVVTADDTLRTELRGLRTAGLVKRCAGFRNSPNRPVHQAHTRAVMRAVARRISHLNDEITLHTKALAGLVDQAAPQLVAEVGIGVPSPPPVSTLRGRIRDGAATKPPTLGWAVPPPSRSPPAKPNTVTGSPGAETANSTRRCTRWRSPDSDATNQPRPTSRDAPPRAKPTGKSDAASNATSPAESFGYSNTTHHPKPPLDRHRSIYLGPVEVAFSGLWTGRRVEAGQVSTRTWAHLDLNPRWSVKAHGGGRYSRFVIFVAGSCGSRLLGAVDGEESRGRSGLDSPVGPPGFEPSLVGQGSW